MRNQTELVPAVALLSALRRYSSDLSGAPRSTGEIACRAAAQGLGALVICELLERIESPTSRLLSASVLAYMGHTIATVDGASDQRQLAGDILRVAGGAVAAVELSEVISDAIRDLFDRRPFGDEPRVFMSHSWQESDDLFLLQDRLRCQLDYLDHSVHIGKAKPGMPDRDLRIKLAHHIRGADVLLVLAHPAALQSLWVREEVRIAVRLGKPIIAVRPHGLRKSLLVPWLGRASVDEVGWNAPAVARRVQDWTALVRMTQDE